MEEVLTEKDLVLEEIVNDPFTVLNIIDKIRDSFEQVFIKYNKTPYHNVYSFYLTGHCPSFARLLYEVFEGNCTILDSDSHVITKIGNEYYDVRGFVKTLEDISKYRDCPIEYFPFVEMELDKNEDHCEEITNELIEIGKLELQEVRETISGNRAL